MKDKAALPGGARARWAARDSATSLKLAQAADQRPLLRRAAIVLAHSGDSPYWIAGLLVILWLGGNGWKREAVLALVGMGLTALVVQAIKWRVKRPRPAGEWGQGYRRLDPHSFPSGHAARATMLAALAVFMGPWWWALALAVWAPLVGLARVAMRVHYVSDIVVGAACGLACGIGLGLYAVLT